MDEDEFREKLLEKWEKTNQILRSLQRDIKEIGDQFYRNSKIEYKGKTYVETIEEPDP